MLAVSLGRILDLELGSLRAGSIPVGTGSYKQLGDNTTKLSFIIQDNFRMRQVAITGLFQWEPRQLELNHCHESWHIWRQLPQVDKQVRLAIFAHAPGPERIALNVANGP